MDGIGDDGDGVSDDAGHYLSADEGNRDEDNDNESYVVAGVVLLWWWLV